jgi:hypothetical protein
MAGLVKQTNKLRANTLSIISHLLQPIVNPKKISRDRDFSISSREALSLGRN